MRRVLVTLLAGACTVALAVEPALAQSSDGTWFDDSNTAAAPAPDGAPPQSSTTVTTAGGNPGAPRVPATPASPQAPPAPGAPLAPSPLLQDQQADQAQAEAPPAPPEDRDPRALTAWNAYVDPYGTWIDDPKYGRVWIPNAAVVGGDFAPYSTGGHWALDSSNQWTWVSDYPFGWVTFHYGRWVWIGGRGWAWVPGLTYAPAWVSWRVPDGPYAYVGWAPLPPAYIWFGGFAYWYPYYPYYPWVYCPSEYVFYPHVHHYIVHDHDGMAYAHHHTRPYYTASPHPGMRTAAAPASPSPHAARVPSGAIPHERVSSQPITGIHGSAMVPGQRYDRSQFQQGGVRQQGVQRATTAQNLRQSPLLQRPYPTAQRPVTYSGTSAYQRPAAVPRGPSGMTYSSPTRVHSLPQSSYAPRPVQSAPHLAPVHTAPRSYGGGAPMSRPSGGMPHGGGGFVHGGGMHGGGGRR